MIRQNTKKHYISIVLISLLLVAMLINISGCSVKKAELKTSYSNDLSDLTISSEETNSLSLTAASEELNTSDIQTAATECKAENSSDASVASSSDEATSNLDVSNPNIEIKAENLMNNISTNTVNGKNNDDNFNINTADFSIELFKKTITEGKNSLISPLSAMLALSMVANGADKETLMQMEKVLGGDISLDELNKYLYSYVNCLTNEETSKLKIVNSIWFNGNENILKVNNSFLQKNADYYNAAVFKSEFDDQTLKDINNWVKNNTDGMIDGILDKIDPNDIMYLINTIAFDAEWETVYQESQISQGEFTAIDGTKQTADYMSSIESVYLDDGKATGFMKPYANGKYSFVALLPNDGISIDEYVSSLTGVGFMNSLMGVENTEAYAILPKFSCNYEIKMNNALCTLGMPNAFSAADADFNKLGKSIMGNIYISKVLQKTFISVDNLGTKAGAATIIEMKGGASPSTEVKTVKLDRPFVYAIIDNIDNLPIFIGTMTSL